MLSHYHLGQIFEQLGDPSKALEYYDALLAIWKDGDPDLTLLRDGSGAGGGVEGGGVRGPLPPR